MANTIYLHWLWRSYTILSILDRTWRAEYSYRNGMFSYEFRVYWINLFTQLPARETKQIWAPPHPSQLFYGISTWYNWLVNSRNFLCVYVQLKTETATKGPSFIDLYTISSRPVQGSQWTPVGTGKKSCCLVTDQEINHSNCSPSQAWAFTGAVPNRPSVRWQVNRRPPLPPLPTVPSTHAVAVPQGLWSPTAKLLGTWPRSQLTLDSCPEFRSRSPGPFSSQGFLAQPARNPTNYVRTPGQLN